MEMKDKIQLQRWVASGASLAEVESVSRFGLVDNERFTERAREVYRWLWTWGAPRFSGTANAMQERVYAKHGMPALNRRYARVSRILARIKAGEFSS